MDKIMWLMLWLPEHDLKARRTPFPVCLFEEEPNLETLQRFYPGAHVTMQEGRPAAWVAREEHAEVSWRPLRVFEVESITE